MALGGALRPVLVARDVADFAWQAWHLVTSTFVSRGRRGGISHPRSFCVAGVALMALGGALGPVLVARDVADFAWQAWHLVTSTFVSRGRRGGISHPRSFCVAGVALMALGGALGPVLVARDAAALCVAGVAPSHIHPSFCVLGVAPSLTHPLSPLCHTPSFTHHLSHPTLSPTSFTHHLSHTTLSPTIFDTPSFTHNFGTHTHTIFHTPLCHTPSLTHPLLHTIFVTHHLSHTIFYTQLCQTPSLTHHVSHTTLSHTTLSHTIFHHTI